jgi:dihydrofolate reductase
MGKVALFIACSIDGYIAKPNDNLHFLKQVEREGEDYGYEAFNKDMDVVLIGRKTYDYVVREIGAEHYDNGSRDIYVLSRTPRPPSGRTIFHSGDLAELIHSLKATKNIYCDGGAEVINALLKQDLIDEMTVSIVPVVLGEGVRLFQAGIPEGLWKLESSKAFESGLVQVHWKKS